MVLFSDFWMQWCLLWFSLCSEIPTTRGIIYFGFSMSLNQQQGGSTERWSCPSLNPCENSHRRGRIHVLGALWEPIPAKHRNPPLFNQKCCQFPTCFWGFPRHTPCNVLWDRRGHRPLLLLEEQVLMAALHSLCRNRTLPNPPLPWNAEPKGPLTSQWEPAGTGMG